MQFKTGGETPAIVPGLKDGRPRPPGTVVTLIVEGDNVYVVDEGEGLSHSLQFNIENLQRKIES